MTQQNKWVGGIIVAALAIVLIIIFWETPSNDRHKHHKNDQSASTTDDSLRAVVALRPFYISAQGKNIQLDLSAVIIVQDETDAIRVPYDRRLHAQLRQVVTDVVSGPQANHLLSPADHPKLLRKLANKARKHISDYEVEEILMTNLLIT